jgi:hypothetical protein
VHAGCLSIFPSHPFCHHADHCAFCSIIISVQLWVYTKRFRRGLSRFHAAPTLLGCTGEDQVLPRSMATHSAYGVSSSLGEKQPGAEIRGCNRHWIVYCVIIWKLHCTKWRFSKDGPGSSSIRELVRNANPPALLRPTASETQPGA